MNRWGLASDKDKPLFDDANLFDFELDYVALV